MIKVYATKGEENNKNIKKEIKKKKEPVVFNETIQNKSVRCKLGAIINETKNRLPGI